VKIPSGSSSLVKGSLIATAAVLATVLIGLAAARETVRKGVRATLRGSMWLACRGKNGPNSAASAPREVTFRALPVLFGQFQKGNSPKFAGTEF